MARNKLRGKVGVKFKAPYTASKRKNMLRNVATELIVNGKIKVTATVAEQLVPEVDRLITLAKRGDIHSRRLAASYLRSVVAEEKEGKEISALSKLFSEIGPANATREGGYTRILKIGNRRGDNAPIVLVELV